MRFLLIAMSVLVLAGCSKPAPDNQPATKWEVGPMPDAGPQKGVDRSHKGQPAPAAMFKNPDGGDISIAKFKGVPVLVNLWATWCAPCVKELPTLDALAQSHAVDGDLGVVAVSQDSGPQPSVTAFLAKLR